MLLCAVVRSAQCAGAQIEVFRCSVPVPSIHGAPVLAVLLGCAAALRLACVLPSTAVVVGGVCAVNMAATAEDEATNSDVEVSEAPEAPASPAAKLSLKVHEIAKDAQNQNGLRHGDYHQYRQYCTRRLKRVRSSRQVRFMFGKGKTFVQKVWHIYL